MATEIKISIVFDDPFMVSRGNDNDQMSIRLMNSELFVSGLSGETISREAAIEGATSEIPRQLPLGMTEEMIQ